MRQHHGPPRGRKHTRCSPRPFARQNQGGTRVELLSTAALGHRKPILGRMQPMRAQENRLQLEVWGQAPSTPLVWSRGPRSRWFGSFAGQKKKKNAAGEIPSVEVVLCPLCGMPRAGFCGCAGWGWHFGWGVHLWGAAEQPEVARNVQGLPRPVPPPGSPPGC